MPGMSNCACGSQKKSEVCCLPFIEGNAVPATAEELMRSRYTAFTIADVDYIEKTTDPASRKGFDRDGTLEWAKRSQWQGLEIVSTSEGLAKDGKGEVEFIARYRIEETDQEHHERAEFRKRDGHWFFVDGKLVRAPVRAEERVGRNDPCPCGSGKKYKKCHGSA